MDIFLLYLFTRLNSLIMVCIVICVGLAIAAFFLSMDLDFASGSDREATIKLRNKLCTAFLVVVCITALIPSQKDAAIILAGYGVLEAVKTDAAKRITSKSVLLIEQTLDKYLTETKEAK